MGVCCGFIRLSDRNIEVLIQRPELVPVLMGYPEVSRGPGRGLLARLFGRPKPTPAPAEPQTLPDARQEDDESDVDKAWQAIHYLLTGTADETDDLPGFLCSGGAEVDGADTGYGPPRAFTSKEVASINTELSALDRSELHRRYHPREMDKRRIYPGIWVRDGDKGFDYIWHHFERLRTLLKAAEIRKQGLIIYYC